MLNAGGDRSSDLHFRKTTLVSEYRLDWRRALGGSKVSWNYRNQALGLGD